MTTTSSVIGSVSLRGVGRRHETARGATRAVVNRRVKDRKAFVVVRAAKGAGGGEDAGAEARRAKRREARRERGAGADDASKKKASGDDEEESGTPKWMEVLQENAEKDPEIAALLEGTNGNPQAIEEKIRARFAEKQEKIYQDLLLILLLP